MDNPSSTDPCEMALRGHSALTHTLSPGGESNHDSCYDSDGSPTSSRRNSTLTGNGGHDAVSRTTSETLAAELDDPVKPKSDNSSTAKVEYALKLGYTEKQIKAAMDELGADIDQNTLLSQLIKVNFEESNSEHAGEFSDTGMTSSGFASSDLTSQNFASRPAKDSRPADVPCSLRPIVIDGSNVAMHHGNKEKFSCFGLRLAVDWFKERGHGDITIFVPTFRKEQVPSNNNITDQQILAELEKENVLKFTPSRQVGGKRIISHDDRYILKLAADTGGIVVSNDHYRDFQSEAEFQEVIEQRILMYTFVQNRFMPPDDPLGRRGPSLAQFLRFPNATLPSEGGPPICPYGKKCTYGNKCKYSHPERGAQPHRSITDELRLNSQRSIMQSRQTGLLKESTKTPLGKTVSLGGGPVKKPLARTRSVNPSAMGGMQAPHPSVLVTEVTGDTKQSSPIKGQAHTGGVHSGLLQPPVLMPGRPHEPLRPVRSDPTAQFYPQQQGGALAAHQMLMRTHSGDLGKASHSVVGGKMSPRPGMDGGNQHKKLERQLSLKGAEDPRLLSKGNRGPTFHFHNPSYPVASPPGSMPVSWQQQQQQHGLRATNMMIDPSLHRQLMHQKLVDQMRVNHRLPVPNMYDQHAPVGRMPSAPEAFPSHSAQEQQQHMGDGGGGMAMHRNSSSSDSNLHMLSEPFFSEGPDNVLSGVGFGKSIWSFPGSLVSPSPPGSQGNQPPVTKEYQLFGNPQANVDPPSADDEPPKTGRITPGACRPGSSDQMSLQALQRQVQEQQRIIENIQENMSKSAENLSAQNTAANSQHRSQVYYHLCGLFPEDKVQAVMAANPTETDPKVFCAMLLNNF